MAKKYDYDILKGPRYTSLDSLKYQLPFYRLRATQFSKPRDTSHSKLNRPLHFLRGEIVPRILSLIVVPEPWESDCLLARLLRNDRN
jgi:hypothetical protein